MKYRVLVSERAVDDVIRNAEWWASRHSRDKAAEWEQAIFAKIYSLDSFPRSSCAEHLRFLKTQIRRPVQK